MEQKLDLVSIYENNYLKTPSSTVIVEKNEEDGSDNDYEANAGGNMPPVPANKKKKKPFDAGACYNEEKNSFNKLFETFMEEFESGDNAFDDSGSDDFTFDGSGSEDDEFGAGDDKSYTLSELKAMTLQELADLIAGNDLDDDFSFDEGDDAIPTESYGQMGAGKHLGNTQTRDGKPSKQPATTRVKSNGDADFSKQETGFAPEDTEGSEGSHLGNTQTRDGKPSKQAASSLVNSNGNAKVGQTQKTGYGKKEGERLF